MQSSSKALAALINLAAFLFNLTFFLIWMNHGNTDAAIMHACFGMFSFVLTMFNFFGYLGAKFKEDMEETYRKIYYGSRY